MADKVLITGGSGGIGAAAVRACAARGAWPVAGYCNNRAAAAETVRQCGAGEILHLDLTRDDLGITGGLPRVDRLMHCAGLLSSQRSLLATQTEELQALFAAHVFGPLKLTKQLLASGSPLKHVLFVLSSAAGCRGSGPYALSKAAALAACKLLAGELAPRGIQLTAFVPGWTDTAMAAAAARDSQRDLEEIKLQHLDGRILSADEAGGFCVRCLFDATGDAAGRLFVWDRRDSREPVQLDFQQVFSLDAPAESWAVDGQGSFDS
ncbi:MAG TPA: SDR family oxidoreductase [Pirellulales bacterium]|nr:SDR family oxidoreductase [Pirellulales bacterium]